MEDIILSKRKEINEVRREISEIQRKLNNLKYEYKKALEEKKNNIIHKWEKYFGKVNLYENCSIASTPCIKGYWDYKEAYRNIFNNVDTKIINNLYKELCKKQTLNLPDDYKLITLNNKWIVATDDEDDYQVIISEDKNMNMVIKKFFVLKALSFLENFQEDEYYSN
jgi:hypothetical protein